MAGYGQQYINLGTVKAILSSTTPPTNQQMLWFDSNSGVQALKYYNFNTTSWTLLTSGAGGATATWGNITGSLALQTDLSTALALLAPLASPTFTGTATAPTVSSTINNNQIATTAFVKNVISGQVQSKISYNFFQSTI